MSEADFSSANVLSRLFSSLSVDKFKESSDVMRAWQQTLYSIKGPQIDNLKAADYGSQLADHSRIIDLKDGILIVETDHPGRIQMFQLYKNYILNGLKQKIPGIPVKNIVFKLKKIETLSTGLRMPTSEELDEAAARSDAEVRAANAAISAANAASSSEKNALSSNNDDGNDFHVSEKETAPLAPELQEIFSQMKDTLKKQMPSNLD